MGYANFFSKLSNRSIFVIVFIIIAVLIIDTSIIRISLFSYSQRSSSFSLLMYALVVLAFAIGQYVILEFVKRKNSENSYREQPKLNVIFKVVSVIQYVLTAILLSIIVEMLFTSRYNIYLVEGAIWISQILAVIIMGLLSQRFISWYRSNANMVVLAYALATAMICLNIIFALLYVTNGLADKPTYIRPFRDPTMAYSSSDDIFNPGYVITSILSFILTWLATVLLIYHRSKKIGRIKYWVIVSLPLVYFVSQFQGLFFNLFTPLRLSDPVLFGIIYTVVFSATKPVGGVLFGIAFWSVARSINKKPVRDYMIISAIGMMMLFSSNQVSALVAAPYPPFGLATISFLALSSYLIFVGVYASAISFSEDTELRKSIRKYALTESKLLDSIGSAQMEQQIQRRVIDLTRQNKDRFSNETGVEPSLSENEVKEYLHEVIEEVSREKTQKGDK